MLFVSVTHWSYWTSVMHLGKCLGIDDSTTNYRALMYVMCASTLVRRFRVLSDGQIEINLPPGWGIVVPYAYLRATALVSVTSNGRWTLVRTRSEGQRVSVMLMNQDIPNPNSPDKICGHNNYLDKCEYSEYQNWNVMPYCPTAFPTIGKWIT